MYRELETIQTREKLNTVSAVDEPGNGGANHRYVITPNNQYQSWEYNSEDEITQPLSSVTNSDPKLYPATLINAAEYDSLKVGAEEFSKNLKENNIFVDYKCFSGCQHGFTHRDLKEYNPEQAKIAWQRIADFIVKVSKGLE